MKKTICIPLVKEMRGWNRPSAAVTEPLTGGTEACYWGLGRNTFIPSCSQGDGTQTLSSDPSQPLPSPSIHDSLAERQRVWKEQPQGANP